MAQPEFDWTFEDVPLDGEARSPTGAPAPLRPGPGPRDRRPLNLLRSLRAWPRWAWWALLGSVAGLLLGGYGFVQLGWLRLQRQIAAEVAYDDARARAREVDAVLGAQVGNDPYWRAQRRAEVALGLPAPLPAGNLLPTSDPAQVLSVRPLGNNLFAALVRRQYADAAGQTFAFDLEQRYYNVAPGEWVRLGTDLNGLVAATSVQGAWFSATVPTNDLPWVRPALVAADEALLAACEAWQSCPPGYRLSLAFNAGPEILNPSLPLRATNPQTGPYPLIFDLGASAPGYPERFVFSAPQIAGRPADAAAQAAYNRALSAHLLGYMAAAISQSARSRSDFLLDALVARMEDRLGLSSAADPVLDPLNFVPAEAVWNQFQGALASGSRAGLADRQRTLALLNVILADQPPSVDGDLLRTVHRPYVARLDDWLAGILGPDDVARAAARWEAANQPAIAAPIPNWSAAEGLALLCPAGVSLVERGAPRRVGPPFDPDNYSAAVLYRPLAGPHLAVTYLPRMGEGLGYYEPQVWVFGPAVDAAPLLVSERSFGIRWGADGAFYFYDVSEPTDGVGTPLQRYDPATGLTTETLRIAFGSEPALSDDRRALLATQVEVGGEVFTTTLALLTLSSEPAVRPLVSLNSARESLSAFALAPGATLEAGQAAYILARFNGSAQSFEIHTLDLATGTDAVVFDSAQDTDLALSWGTQLLWSPLGSWLNWSGYGSVGAPRFFAAPAAGGAVREWPASGSTGYFPFAFAADEAYLATQGYNQYEQAEFMLLDLNAPAETPALTLTGRGFAWAPTGHTFAFSNDLGVFLVDAATGDYEWLQAEPCDLDWSP